MIYTSDINHLIANIPIKNIIAYLDDLGWQHVKTKRDEIIKVYSTPSELEHISVTVPLKRDLADYNLAMKHLIGSISEAYKKDIKRIIMELLNPNADILKIRIVSNETESGVIGIGKGIDLFNNAKSMLIYSAMETIDYKQIYLGRPKGVVTSMIDACQIGQTEIGSFIVSIICPFYEFIKGEPQQLSLFDNDEFSTSKTRKATTQLITSLSKIKTAVLAQNIDFLSTPESNISVNFFEALIKTGLSNNNCQVNFNIDWSPITPNNDISIDAVCLSNETEYEAIKSTIYKIKKHEPETKTILGKIRDLKSNPNKREKGGEIVLAYVGEEGKTTSIKLTQYIEELHNLSIEAYSKNMDVKVIAVQDGSSNWVCADIEIIN